MVLRSGAWYWLINWAGKQTAAGNSDQQRSRSSPRTGFQPPVRDAIHQCRANTWALGCWTETLCFLGELRSWIQLAIEPYECDWHCLPGFWLQCLEGLNLLKRTEGTLDEPGEPFSYVLCQIGPLCQFGFPGGSEGKESAYSAGDPGSISWKGRSPGEGDGNPLQYSCLENSMDRGVWQATIHGVTKKWTWLSNITCLYAKYQEDPKQQ